MGASRKTEIVHFNRGNAASTPNVSITHRNLPKANLGGVIFGCKNGTMRECLQKQLFGLPAPHFSYVKNIEPGLPLFLFNYSDRKIYGVYEAASCGQLNIDHYAWGDGSEKTQFPAQVQIRVRLQCQPLVEDQFRRIIVDNYYTSNHFWFELDHSQANRLISLLASLAIAPSSSLPQRTLASSMPQQTFASNNRLAKLSEGYEQLISMPKKYGHFISSAGKSGPSEDFPSSGTKNQPCEISASESISEEQNEKDLLVKPESIVLGHGPEDLTPECHEQNAPVEHDVQSIEQRTLQKSINPEEREEESSALSSDNSTIIEKLIQEVGELKAYRNEQALKLSYLEEKLIIAENEIQRLKDHCMTLEPLHDPSFRIPQETLAEALDEQPLDPGESILLLGGFDGSSWRSSVDSYFPKKNVIKSLMPMSSSRSYASAAMLNEELYVFGGAANGDCTWYNSVESYNIAENKWKSQPSLILKRGSLAGAVLNGKIFAIGGGNGKECFSLVEMLDLDIGRWIPSRSMVQKRFALAAIEFNGAIYACGGYDGTSYLNSAERLDPREYSWSKIENMSSKRGCHSMAVLNEKLYAVGGYDGISMVPSVEIYDPRRALWIPGEPMMCARGYSAVAVIDQSMYAIGGMGDADGLLETIECYKEGQGWRDIGSSAVGKRSFMTAAVL